MFGIEVGERKDFSSIDKKILAKRGPKGERNTTKRQQIDFILFV